MAKIEVEIIESHYEKAAGNESGEVIIMGIGVFKLGQRVSGSVADLKPLIDAGHARLVEIR